MTDSLNTLQSHYLKVQALTPLNPSTNAIPASTPDFFTNTLSSGGLPLSLAIFFVLLTIGIITLLIIKVRDINKILTVLFLSLMTSAIPYGTRLVREETRWQSQAGPSVVPKNVTVSTVTDHSFAVSWDTDTPNAGAIRVRPTITDTGPQKVVAEADHLLLTGHLLTVDNLKPNQVYYFEILSGSTWYDLNGTPLMITTLEP